ncbi:MAG: ISAs1 family transposase [Lachnospiraceae bacterium]|jgi:predicted transposase YbfD/YdcC|nr:ISAs1 family transposase [Lachnospiraceae bacterium]
MSGKENDFSLVGCMEEVPDPRAPYNQKHKLLDIIVIAVTAILCGMDTWNEIEDWAKSKREWLGSFLELPGGIPSHDTINRVFQMIDPEKFHDAFFRWTGAVAGKIEGVVAIDGKTVRRSRDDAKGNRPAHVVSAWACEASLVLGQLKVDEKTNEIKAIPELLDILCLKGCVVTIDAMGTQKEIAEKIIDKEADYILQVKGNQGRLLDDIALYFEKDVFPCKKKDLAEERRYYKDVCFDHGRQETREYYVENEIGWLKAGHPEWKGLSGIGACVSTVTEKGVATKSISYSMYSRSGMGAEEYGKCKRAHWGVENSLHWVLDIGFREDESRMRAGNAAENVNVLRHIGTNLLKQEKSCKMGIASKRKKCGYDPDYLYKVLGGLNTGLD